MSGSFENEDRVYEYEYRCQDSSVAQPYMVRFLKRHILNRIPRRVSPNALTMAGFSSGLFVWATLFFFRDSLQEGSLATVLFLAMAAGLIAYAALDQLDGLQARRQARSSPLGDFVDHWCDALLVNLIPTALALAIGFPFILSLLLATSAAICFWASNWETRKTGQRDLPHFGGLELLWFGTFFCLVTALFGIRFWQTPILGFPLSVLPGIGVLIGLVLPLRLYLEPTKACFRDLLGVLVTILPLVVWAIATHVQGAGSAWPLLLIGLTSTKHTGDVLRHHLIGTVYRRFDPMMTLPACLLGLNAVVSHSPSVETVTASVLTGIVLLRLTYQLLHTWGHVTQCLREADPTSDAQDSRTS